MYTVCPEAKRSSVEHSSLVVADSCILPNNFRRYIPAHQLPHFLCILAVKPSYTMKSENTDVCFCEQTNPARRSTMKHSVYAEQAFN